MGRGDPREREVFGLLADGRSNAAIGEAMFLSEPIVKAHVGRLLRKREARDRVQLVVLAYRCGPNRYAASARTSPCQRAYAISSSRPSSGMP